MEMKAYLEGMARRWWLFLLLIVMAVFVGRSVANDLTPQYTAATTILMNDKVLSSTAFSSSFVQINTPTSYVGEVVSPAIFARIIQTYPRMTQSQLQKNVVVSVDGTDQLMLISVTDISPFATADIANYLAKRFVNTQIANVQHQLGYYNQWLTDHINTTQTDANQVSGEISSLIPQRAFHSPPPTLTPGQKVTLTLDQSRLDEDNRELFLYRQAQVEIQQVLPMVQTAFIIIKPATEPTIPNTNPLSTTIVEVIAIAVAVLLAIIVCITLDFFTPVVRYRQEISRVVQIPVLAEVPSLLGIEQARLFKRGMPLFAWRVKPLRLFCAAISARAMKQHGFTLLLSGSHIRRRFAATIALFLANKGLRTLLIDAHFGAPTTHMPLQFIGPATLRTPAGHQLTFVAQTGQPNLFFLPATATPLPGHSMSESLLLEMLPELQRTFDIILIDGEPMDRAQTHLIAPKVSQILLLVKKRSDKLREIKKTALVCEMLKTDTQYVLLT